MKVLLVGNKGRLQDYVKEFLLFHHEVIDLHSDDAFDLLLDIDKSLMVFSPEAIVYVGGEVYVTSKMVRNNFSLPMLLANFANLKKMQFIYLSSQIVYAEALFDYRYAQKDRYSVYLCSKVVALHELGGHSNMVSHIMVGSIDSGRGSTTIEKISSISKYLRFMPIIVVPNLCFSSASYENVANAVLYCLKYRSQYVNCYETYSISEIIKNKVKTNSLICEFSVDWVIEILLRFKIIRYKTYMYLKEAILVRLAAHMGNETVL